MADRVHPAPPPPPPPTDAEQPHPSFARPAAPPAGTYIVQVPKDQILRVPPPDRARRYKHLSTSLPARRRLLRRACCCFFFSALLLLLLAASFAAAVYLVYRPRAPSFSVASLSIHGLNSSSASSGSAAALSPRLNATVRADNSRNRKVAVEYRGGGTVAVFYSSNSGGGGGGEVRLAEGEWPALRQEARNVREVEVGMEGEGVRLNEEQAAAMEEEKKASAVPMVVEAEVPVRLWFGKVMRTWTVRVRARCDVSVERLDGDAKAVNRGCKVKVKPLWWWW